MMEAETEGREREKEVMSLLVLKMEKDSMNQGIQMAVQKLEEARKYIPL